MHDMPRQNRYVKEMSHRDRSNSRSKAASYLINAHHYSSDFTVLAKGPLEIDQLCM